MREINNDKAWLGKKFGRLTVVGFRNVESGKYHAWAWDCKCDCGNMVYGLRPRSLKDGTTRSCGCIKKEQDRRNLGEKRRTHGKTNTRLYGIWSHIKARCYNPNVLAYKNYGGRGIFICDEWKDSFEAFYEWAISSGYREDLTIERIDVNKGYSPDNCCWVTLEEQAKNKRSIRYVELDGEKLPLKTACKRLGLPYQAVHLRITRYGMSVEDALSKPFSDKRDSLAQKCRELGLPYQTIVYRLKSGWGEDRAFSEPIRKR